jgi:hypothetical protein
MAQLFGCTPPNGAHLDVSWKEGAVIGARENFIRSSLTSDTGINDISIKLKQYTYM